MPAAGVPLSKPALLRVTPVGKGPFVVKVGNGYPLATKLKLPTVFVSKVVLVGLVMDGA